jgi:hypothetical protein
MNSIPVIGTAVVKDTFWVSRLITSVDYPVDDFFIINNNGRGEITEQLDLLAKIKHKFIKKITVTHMPANIGCAAAWNLVIKCYLNAPYWIIVNDDVAFKPNLLKEMIDRATEDPDVGMIHGHQGDFFVGSWDLFLIRDHVVQRYGLFDENLYPAYCEDADYHMRYLHNPIKKIMNLEGDYYHGFGSKREYHLHGSQTEKSEPGLKEKLDVVNNMNIEYLTEKWGKGWRMQWPTELPWKDSAKTLGDTRFDLEFARKKYLGF